MLIGLWRAGRPALPHPHPSLQQRLSRTRTDSPTAPAAAMPPAAKRKGAPTAAAQPSLRAFFSSRADNGVVGMPAHTDAGASPQKPRAVLPRSPSGSSSSFGGRTLTQEEQDLARAIAASLADVVQQPPPELAPPPVVLAPAPAPQPGSSSHSSPGEASAAPLRSDAGPSRPPKPLFMGDISDDDDIVDDEPEETRPGPAQAENAAPGPSRLPAAAAPAASAKPNAFARLMAPASDALQWAGADAVEQNNYKGAGRTRRAARTAPFYKILEGMPICVDGFRFGKIHGCTAYFLSHFHSDHYIGLSKAWTHGPVYCSAETASLVRSSLYVPPEFVVALPFDEPFEVPNTGGVIVTPISANHCPGSALFHFRGPQTRHILPPPPGGHHPALRKGMSTYLHCGDFRACPAHVEHPTVKAHKLDIIYLDTTYCNARYCFPPQPLVVEACGELVSKLAPAQCQGPDVGLEGAEQWRERAPTKREAAAMKTEASESLARKAMQGWLQPDAEAGASNLACIKDEPVVKDEPLLDDAGLDEEDAWESAHADVDGGFRDEVDRDELDEDAEAMYQEALGDPERPGEEALWRVKDEPVDEDERKALALLDVKPDVKPAASSSAAASGSTPAVRSAFDMLGKSNAETFPDSTTRGRLLVVVGTYTIGKEKIVLSCARALRSKVYCADPRKYRVYAQLDEPELHARLTRNPLEASVHVTGLRMINGEALRQHVAAMRKLGADWQRAVAFRPTGWSYRPPAGIDTVSPALERVIEVNQATGFDASGLQPTRDSTSEFRIYGVPYSEHSSFFELSAFALSVDYERIIATVNVGSPQSRAKMAKWFERWKAERKRRAFVPVTPRASTFF